jgi:serine/threonine-protein kinase
MQSQLPSYPVPATLIGMQRDALPGAIDEFGWKIEDEEEYRDGTEPGQILATDPGAGQELREGSTLTVVVSRGPTPVDLPADLVGMTQDEAREALEAVGLVAQFVPQVDRDVPEGQVIGFADGDPGRQVPKGSTVRLTVATDDLEMPDLEGRPVGEAVAELEAMGLVVEQATDEADDDHPVGTVVRTDPRQGRKVDEGDTVTVFVAADEAVEVPDVQGDDLDEATEEIEDAGLVVGQVTGPRGGVVVTTWPFPGSQVAGRSAVDLVMIPGG